MKKDFSKSDIKEEIQKLCFEIKKTPKEIKKIKKLAMGYNLKIGALKKSFCKKCLGSYKIPKIRIKNNYKRIICENCGYVNKWRLNSS